jgi:vitamin B12 transporter
MIRPRRRRGIAVVALAWLVAGASPAVAQPQQPQPAQKAYPMPEIVVTATGRPEPLARVAGTVQVIDQDRIAKSTAKSVTELFAENAVGFMSEWTPGQTSLNIRGGATDGQGRDFRSQILVLINGHRAGTANISKLSTADVERIEIVRGPSSVVYGSQNMGGVVNIILKTGRTAPGIFLEGSAGSWQMVEGRAQYGGVAGPFDWYVGGFGQTQGNFQIGGGAYEQNTSFTRASGTVALGYAFDENNRVDVTLRTDGIYGAGFRGSSANVFAYDQRFNRSVDATFNGRSPDGRMGVMFQAYYVTDVDDLNNPSPLSNLNALAARTNFDDNRRQLDIVGTRFQPSFKPWGGNELLLGIDWERSWINSTRWRLGGSAVTQLSPQDNNQTDNIFGFYFEDSQLFFDDRLLIRGGVRQNVGSTALDATPFAPTLIPGTNTYQALTYSVGATLKLTDWLNARAGASSGFRAPTATELGANFTTTPIGTTIFGNPGLVPETAQQFELGGTATWKGGRFDAALFQNVITNRIAPVTVSSTGGVVVQRQANNTGNIVVQGLEFQLETDMITSFGLPIAPGWLWNVFGNSYYNFKMTDYGAVAAAGTDMATRINQYGLAMGTLFGQATAQIPWNVQILSILRGPMWYNTEEALSPVFFPGQVRNTTVYQKDPFWVWNMRGELEFTKGAKLFGAVNNVFDTNQHPIFIALDQTPCGASLAAQNGACGNSMPGRQFILGFQIRL